MSERKTVYILVGPKGSGKTYIGTILEQELGLKFLRVEPLALSYIEEFGMPEGGLERDGFDLEEAAIHEIMATDDAMVFEATGSSIYFPSVLENLGELYSVKMARVYCPLDICFGRVKNRDLAGHHFVSDEKIRIINEKAASMIFDWALEIDNSGPAKNQDIITQFRRII